MIGFNSTPFSLFLISDLDKVQTGIGEKCVILFQWIGSLICGFTIGFVRDWRLTLALLGITPFLAVGGALMTIVRIICTLTYTANFTFV